MATYKGWEYTVEEKDGEWNFEAVKIGGDTIFKSDIPERDAFMAAVAEDDNIEGDPNTEEGMIEIAREFIDTMEEDAHDVNS